MGGQKIMSLHKTPKEINQKIKLCSRTLRNYDLQQDISHKGHVTFIIRTFKLSFPKDLCVYFSGERTLYQLEDKALKMYRC